VLLTHSVNLPKTVITDEILKSIEKVGGNSQQLWSTSRVLKIAQLNGVSMALKMFNMHS
jgi:hypothetical protein